MLVVNKNIANLGKPSAINEVDLEVDLRKTRATRPTLNEQEQSSSTKSNAREFLDSPEAKQDDSSESSRSQGKLRNQYLAPYNYGSTLQPIIEMKIEETDTHTAEIDRH